MKSKGKKKGYIGIAITAILLIVTVVADLLVSRYITMISFISGMTVILFMRCQQTKHCRRPQISQRNLEMKVSYC